MKVEIRAATAADLPAIGSIANEVQSLHRAAHPDVFRPPAPDGSPPGYLAEQLAQPQRVCLVADAGGTLVGYAGAEIRDEPETALRHARATMEVHELGVRSTHRGQGIGARLLDALRAMARERGLSAMTLTVYHFNAEARAFYLRHGFEPLQERLRLTLDRGGADSHD